jgi:hypothetical protein
LALPRVLVRLRPPQQAVSRYDRRHQWTSASRARSRS